MRICHVAHGITSIPPSGWGSTETLIWDLKEGCEAAGHEFHIVNTANEAAVLAAVEKVAPDIVHVHRESYFKLVPLLKSRVRIIGSRWPRLYDPANAAEAQATLAGDAHVCCASDWIRQRCRDLGVAERRLFLLPPGVEAEAIRFAPEAYFENRALCLAAINPRKRQHLLKDIAFVDFAGPIRPGKNPEFERHPNYLGEWPKTKVRQELTDYATLALLSQAETSPLAIREALMAGLGLVVSEAAAIDLDLSLPFIDVVPESRIDDRSYLETVLRKNQAAARTMRPKIRQYAIDHFGASRMISSYLGTLQSLLDQAQSETSTAPR
jgi:hypothetical protein